jgi:hypothetical protein
VSDKGMSREEFLTIIGNHQPLARTASKLAWDVALQSAAAIARANTSTPRIWQDGKWHNSHGEEIAKAIEALMVEV